MREVLGWGLWKSRFTFKQYLQRTEQEGAPDQKTLGWGAVETDNAAEPRIFAHLGLKAGDGHPGYLTLEFFHCVLFPIWPSFLMVLTFLGSGRGKGKGRCFIVSINFLMEGSEALLRFWWQLRTVSRKIHLCTQTNLPKSEDPVKYSFLSPHFPEGINCPCLWMFLMCPVVPSSVLFLRGIIATLSKSLFVLSLAVFSSALS